MLPLNCHKTWIHSQIGECFNFDSNKSAKKSPGLLDTRAAIYQALKKEYFPIIAHLSMHDMEIKNKGKPISSGTMIWGRKCKLKQRKWVNGIPCCWRNGGGESSNLVCARRYEQGFLPKKGVAQNFVPFVRRLQHANKVEHVNMFVILSDTGKGM